MLLRYRGSEGMLAWAFHRISGVAIWAFVVLHVIDILLVGREPDAVRRASCRSTPARSAASWRCSSARRCCTTRSTACGSSSWTSGRAMTRYHRQLWYANWVLFVAHRHPGRDQIMAPAIRFAPPFGLRRHDVAVVPRSGRGEAAAAAASSSPIWYLHAPDRARPVRARR